MLQFCAQMYNIINEQILQARSNILLLDGKVNDLNKSIQRNSSMDLLKIIAIYLVVLTHSATKSKFTFLDGYSATRIEVQMCELGGFADGLNIGVQARYTKHNT